MSEQRTILHLRARLLRAIRYFFDTRDFIEVETPLRIDPPALELHIDALPSGEAWLRTSPELHMKRLVATGLSPIYQIGACFRAGEAGRRHHPEFTMLEWYEPGDCLSVLETTQNLLRHLTTTLEIGRLRHGGYEIDPWAEWAVLDVADAFRQHAGWDPCADFDSGRFEMDLIDKVEPALPTDRPVVLQNYPAQLAALARIDAANPTVAERWELYLGGLEVANAYSELCDASEQRRRFETCARERAALGKTVYDIDEEFLAALERGMPATGGIAVGIDRLVMLFAGANDIRDVRVL